MRFVTSLAMAALLVACGESATTKSAPAPAPEYTAEENAAAVAALPEPLNAADYDNGRRVFGQCRSCHVVASPGRNGVGPNLHGVIGAQTGRHAEGFAYSPAMQNAGLTWDVATLNSYLERPNAVVPGTRMAFVGIRDPDDRRDVIAYIAVESQR